MTYITHIKKKKKYVYTPLLGGTDLVTNSTGSHSLVLAVDEVVEVPVGPAHHPDPVTLRQLVQVKLTVLASKNMCAVVLFEAFSVEQNHIFRLGLLILIILLSLFYV